MKKRCYQCELTKKTSEFSKNKRRLDGLQSDCKDCQKEYRVLNRETILEQQKEWYKKKIGI